MGMNARERRGVLICGAYGHGNAGDEAILDAIVGQMRSLGGGLPITVLSRRPQETAARLGLPSLHTFHVPGFLSVMRRTKLYINGGGSLMQDVTSRRSLWYYLFTLWAAKKCGCRVLMYGCGIGPVQRQSNRRLASRIINGCVDAITLRERESASELASWGVTRPEIILASDPALTIAPAPDTELDSFFAAHGMDPAGRYIGFCLRRWPGFWEKASCFAEAARRAYEVHGLTPVFLSINLRNDGEAADHVLEDLRDIPCHTVYDPLPASLAVGLLSRMSAVVSMRLHGLIFAAGQGMPLVAVSYDPKVAAFMDYIGQELCVPLDALEPGTLAALVDRAAALAPERERLRENANALRATERRNLETAARLLDISP